MAANAYEKLPKVIEDAFIKVSFEDDDASTTSTHKAYDEWIKNASADRVSTDEYSHALFKKGEQPRMAVLWMLLNIVCFSIPQPHTGHCRMGQHLELAYGRH